MAIRLWTSDLAIGDYIQDAEHHRLVALIDTVIASVDDQPDTKHTVDHLKNLIDFVRRHFAGEEAAMRRLECASLEPHMAEHTRRLQQLQDLVHKMESDEQVTQLGLYYFLRAWLRQHILTFDMQMHASLGSTQSNFAQSAFSVH
jgi:hemerythrin-like metal-binding protein